MGIAQVFWEMLEMMFNICLSSLWLSCTMSGAVTAVQMLACVTPLQLSKNLQNLLILGLWMFYQVLSPRKTNLSSRNQRRLVLGLCRCGKEIHCKRLLLQCSMLFKDGLSVSIAVHTKISPKKAKKYAKEFAKVLGRVPTFFRTSVKNLHLFPGKLGEEACGAWGHFKTGTISLCVEDGLEKIKKGTCEELFVHECTHVTVDPLVLQDAAAYACSMSKDQQFISTYAKMNPFVEDVAESLLMWYAVRVRQDRLDKNTKDIIEQTIPNRLEYFDMAAKNYLR